MNGSQYEVLHERTSITRLASTVYGYDRLARLTSVALAGTTTYTYDPLGNRLSRTRDGIPASYAYDRADRITSGGAGGTYTVNANGNLTARGSDSFVYDQANRLTSATVGGTTTVYAYDGDGKRVSMTVGGVTTRYVYDVSGKLPMLLDDGTRKYIYGAGGLAFTVDGSGNVRVPHSDGLGSVRAVSDSTPSVVQTYQTDEFGVPAEMMGALGQPLQYTGEPRDGETGFVYLRARVYDPQIGRFLQRDTLAKSAPGGQGWNRYAYVGNNPVNQIDPSGHGPECAPLRAVHPLVPVLCEFADEAAEAGAPLLEKVGAEALVIAARTGPTLAVWAQKGQDKAYIVYYAVKDNAIQYVGITTDFVRREAEHLANGIRIRPIGGLENASRAEARSVEQVLIERARELYGTVQDGGSLLNRINSISPRREEIYQYAIQRGGELLEQVKFTWPGQ